MRKTCYNCSHFHACLTEDDSYYHIHNYCDVLNKSLYCNMYSLINSYLDDCTNTELHRVDLEKEGLDSSMYDDLETGEAYCYRFAPVDKDFWPEERFQEAFIHNKRLALYIIKKILNDNYTLEAKERKEDKALIYEKVPLEPDERDELEALYNKIENYNLE